MTVLTNDQEEKVRQTIEELSSVYWREIFAVSIPYFERGQPIMNQVRKARDKLNEVLGE